MLLEYLSELYQYFIILECELVLYQTFESLLPVLQQKNQSSIHCNRVIMLVVIRHVCCMCTGNESWKREFDVAQIRWGCCMSTDGESSRKQLVAPLGRWGAYMCPDGKASSITAGLQIYMISPDAWACNLCMWRYCKVYTYT